jgi:hypothetical protein
MEDILSKISIGLKSMHATWLGLQVEKKRLEI